MYCYYATFSHYYTAIDSFYNILPTDLFLPFLGQRGNESVSEGRPVNRKIQVTFYLLPKLADKTPKGNEEAGHLQAGLGRRTTVILESYTHDEVSQLTKRQSTKKLIGPADNLWTVFFCKLRKEGGSLATVPHKSEESQKHHAVHQPPSSLINEV